MVRGQFHLAHEMTGQEHGAALRGQSLEHAADPADAVGVETVDGFVEDQHSGVAQHGGGDPQALGHAQRQCVGSFPGHGGQTDHV
jgi:hypothetical protein